jgi:opacity protein-like surface antigen
LLPGFFAGSAAIAFDLTLHGPHKISGVYAIAHDAVTMQIRGLRRIGRSSRPPATRTARLPVRPRSPHSLSIQARFAVRKDGRMMIRFSGLILFAGAAFAQQYEIGATSGYGIYRNGSIYSASETVQAGIRNRFAAGILIADQFSNYVTAEFNYLYQDGHPFLKAAGVNTDIQGNSQTLTVGLLFHFKPPRHRWRPFLAGSVGAKDYAIAGPEPFPQPIPQIASLTTNDTWKLVFSVGGGVKYRLLPRTYVRAEFRDYLTTFPRQQIVPAPHNTARGIFEQFTPLFGLSYTF